MSKSEKLWLFLCISFFFASLAANINGKEITPTVLLFIAAWFGSMFVVEDGNDD